MITNNTTDSDKICSNGDLEICENKACPISGGIIALIVVISIFVLIACIILVMIWVKKREKLNFPIFKKKRLENKIYPEPKKALEDEENSPNNGSENVVKMETVAVKGCMTLRPQSVSEFAQWVILNQNVSKLGGKYVNFLAFKARLKI